MPRPQSPLNMYSRRHFLQMSAIGVAGATLSSACSGTAGESAAGAAAANYPEQPITMIVCFEAGGGTDVGARLLQPFLEKELGGATVNVVNQPAGGGWVGWNELLSAEPDGYTIGFLNTPNIISGALNPELGIDAGIGDFGLIGNVVTDYGAIAVRPNDKRFSTIDELIEHARRNRITTTSTGVGSDDQLSALGINDRYDTKFRPIGSEGSAEGVTRVLGGNVDVLFANIGEVTIAHNDGQLKALAVMSPERSKFLPEVPALSEAGYPGVVSWSSRGLGAPNGIQADVMEVLVKASARAIQNEEYIAKLSKQGLQVNYLAPNAYQKMLSTETKRVQRLGSRYIW